MLYYIETPGEEEEDEPILQRFHVLRWGITFEVVYNNSGEVIQTPQKTVVFGVREGDDQVMMVFPTQLKINIDGQ
jgi:hypothetical protein